MKKLSLLFSATLLFIACEKNKIAYVDNSRLINEYQEKVDLEAEYNVKIQKFSQKADSIGRILQQEAKEFENQVKNLSQSTAQQKYNEILQKRQQVSQQFQNEENQLTQQSQQQIDSLIKKVKAYVKTYGKENGYTYILGANDAGSVLYGEESQDITNTILKKLNDDYKK
ncbi:OmpH family outer membrane protein [Robertkochia solimangrovi]|uniref:OmpH family outer membrane protein n=1 Tax=Robertkochia solimangrovi TaxID=2213046 RepID=UPI001180491C|nr:OmpH family outer membrane protein [Robertkochia solimangrovi]TRZ46062.1 OmpH family outer membrane protein [Robertkochia solimangrovi]